MIGRCRTVQDTFKFAFTLTTGGATTSFDENTASKNGTNYNYVRDATGWYLVVSANATINFSKLSHNIDFSLCGGGGGGGGSSQYYNYNGGRGGGGAVENRTGVKLALNTNYSIVIGAGGARGERSGSGWGGYGVVGGASSFNSVSAAGGPRGDGANNSGSGANGSPQRAAAYLLGDSSRINRIVSGYATGYRGGGGAAGINAAGGAGVAGLFVIRSSLS